MLLVVSRAESDAWGQARWSCSCDCGKSHIVRGLDLRRGKTRSCGCAIGDANRARLTTHGHTAQRSWTAEWLAWRNMRARCRPTYSGSADYYDRGIRVHADWDRVGGFDSFLDHVGPHPGPGYSLDRIDNDGNYEPGNVQWATRVQQNNNRRDKIRNGQHNKMIAERDLWKSRAIALGWTEDFVD